LKTSLKWSMTTHLVILRYFWKRFGLFNSIDGLQLTAMEVLLKLWMNF
jgi:hypothetical protein